MSTIGCWRYCQIDQSLILIPISDLRLIINAKDSCGTHTYYIVRSVWSSPSVMLYIQLLDNFLVWDCEQGFLYRTRTLFGRNLGFRVSLFHRNLELSGMGMGMGMGTYTHTHTRNIRKISGVSGMGICFFICRNCVNVRRNSIVY